MHISRAEPTYLLKFEDVSVVGVTSTGLQVGKGFESVNGSRVGAKRSDFSSISGTCYICSFMFLQRR